MSKTLTWAPVKTIEDACGRYAKYGQHAVGCGGPYTLGSMSLDGGPYRDGELTGERVATDWARVEGATFEEASADA